MSEVSGTVEYPAPQLELMDLQGEDWGRYRNCLTEPERFFPSKGFPFDAVWACGNCAVRNLCLEELLDGTVPPGGTVAALTELSQRKTVMPVAKQDHAAALLIAEELQMKNMERARARMEKQAKKKLTRPAVAGLAA